MPCSWNRSRLRLREDGNGGIFWEKVTELKTKGAAPGSEIRDDERVRKMVRQVIDVSAFCTMRFRVV
jgi:hypothetical protein